MMYNVIIYYLLQFGDSQFEASGNQIDKYTSSNWHVNFLSVKILMLMLKTYHTTK